MGASNPRDNARPSKGAATGGAGAAVVSCDVNALVAVVALSDSARLPVQCDLAASGGRVVLMSADGGIGELAPGDIADRILACLARKHLYVAVVRDSDDGPVADVRTVR